MFICNFELQQSFVIQDIFTIWVISNELQELQWHNLLYMKLYTYANHVIMLQLNHYNYCVIWLQLHMHNVLTL
jgi:hypothetical protein